jgi:hypothetical protein
MDNNYTKLVQKYKKTFNESSYLNVLDNDLAYELNDNKALSDHQSHFLNNHSFLKEKLMIKVEDNMLENHIREIWSLLDDTKKIKVYNKLMKELNKFTID